MVLSYLGYYCLAESWDSCAAIRDVARQAANVVPPGAKVFSWVEPDTNLLFYFGRTVWAIQSQIPPPVPRTKPQRDSRFGQWLTDNPGRAGWLFAHPKQAGQLSQWGYAPAVQVDRSSASREAPTLYRAQSPPQPHDQAGGR